MVRSRDQFERVLVSLGAKVSVGLIIVNCWAFLDNFCKSPPNFCKSCPNNLNFLEDMLLVEIHKNLNHQNIKALKALFQRAIFWKT